MQSGRKQNFRKSNGGGETHFNPFSHEGQGAFKDPYDRNSIAAPTQRATVVAPFIPMKPSRSTAPPTNYNVIRSAGSMDYGLVRVHPL